MYFEFNKNITKISLIYSFKSFNKELYITEWD